MNKYNQRQQIIRAYLNGKLSKEQNARLETWYLLNAEEADTPEPEIDYEKLSTKIFTKILDQVHGTDQQAGTAKVSKLNRSFKNVIRIAIAASILLISGVIYTMFKNGNAGHDKFVIAKKYDLSPGTDKAILTLSDGSTVDLNKDTGEKVAVEAGVEITKATDGTLVYKTVGNKNKSNGFNTISTPVGGQYTVILPDGSKVWLNAGSSLKYPIAFAEDSRNVTLTGEGYFEIAHVEGRDGRLPFFVSVFKDNLQLEKVEVLGTHFNINAYADEPFVKTTLLKGSVSIALNNGQTTLLQPGQQSKLINQKIQLQDADTEMAVAWKNDEFVFREDLFSVMRKVARWYDVEVIYDKTAPEKLMLGGWMSRRTNISEVLNHIQLTGKVHFKLEGRRVIVSK